MNHKLKVLVGIELQLSISDESIQRVRAQAARGLLRPEVVAVLDDPERIGELPKELMLLGIKREVARALDELLESDTRDILGIKVGEVKIVAETSKAVLLTSQPKKIIVPAA